ncbi:MAG: DUF2442 domain-containing protein [Deltaproteobacteria bacterium]|nr:DUF2442 domain-containing protein [Deltaproteobacteria bacterium]
MVYVEDARYAGDYRLWIRLNTGVAGEVDLSDLVASEAAAAPLRDVAAFAQFFLDAWPTVAWPCGFDVAPESLERRLAAGTSRAA